MASMLRELLTRWWPPWRGLARLACYDMNLVSPSMSAAWPKLLTAAVARSSGCDQRTKIVPLTGTWTEARNLTLPRTAFHLASAADSTSCRVPSSSTRALK